MLCTAFLAAASDPRRRRFRPGACTLQSFDIQIALLNKACCNPADADDDKCQGGVPKNCDYDCAIT